MYKHTAFYGLCFLPLVWAHPTATKILSFRSDANDTAATLENSVLSVPPLVIPGSKLAAAQVQKRAGNLPAISFSDEAKDSLRGPEILTNFLETRNLDTQWGPTVCKIITKFSPTVNGNSGVFNYTVQGPHKKGLSLVHEGKNMHLYAAFMTLNKDLLPQYDLMNLCTSSFHQAAQTYHELKYGFFDIQTAYSVRNNHRINLLPVASSSKRSTFSGPIGIINIQIGDEAEGISLFNLNGLPA